MFTNYRLRGLKIILLGFKSVQTKLERFKSNNSPAFGRRERLTYK